MTYILIFPVFISYEVYYVETLELAEQKINELCISQIEIEEVRIFEIAREIPVKNLFE
jgi:hypothetical protein